MTASTALRLLAASRKRLLFVCAITFVLLWFASGYDWFHWHSFGHSKLPGGNLRIISATYFDSISNYDNDTAVIFFSADRRISQAQKWECRSENGKGETKVDWISPTAAFDPECKWIEFTARCRTVSQPISLSLGAADSTVALPLRYAESKHYPVVACFSPLFFNERWPAIIFSIESYVFGGVSRQAYYLMSALAPVHSLLRAYEAAGIIELNLWPMGGNGFAVNNLAWRDQSGAHNDCFLKYQKAADFIIVADIDDILFPRRGRSLLDEFSFFAQIHPKVSGFFYPRLESEVVIADNYRQLHLGKSFDALSVGSLRQTGKTVYRARMVDHVWLHWPGRSRTSTSLFKMAPSVNAFIHARNWTFVKEGEKFESQMLKRFNYRPNPLYSNRSLILTRSEVDQIQLNFSKRFPLNTHRQFLSQLNSTKSNYYDPIDACYQDMYKLWHISLKHPELTGPMCTTPTRCRLPSVPGLKCAVVEADYVTKRLANGVSVETVVGEKRVRLNEDGCSIL